jgi:methylthioribose-1-phosphate isomerase
MSPEARKGEGPEPIPTIAWTGRSVRILDQTRLPAEEVYLDIETVEALCEAIRMLRIRGAPALGIAGAMGLALGALRVLEAGGDLEAAVPEVAERIRRTRPTAVNLGWALDRLLARWRASAGQDPEARVRALMEEAQRIHAEDLEMSRAMGRAGLEVLRPGARILTHCNTGGLATGGLGTALAVVFEAHARGLGVTVYADETRPLLQGARLTTWELGRQGIPCTLLVDGAAAWALSRGMVDVVLIGADRIARNGDTANKIGSHMLALAARTHGVPFYVVAPTSSFDPELESGEKIPIEERAADEVRCCGGRPTAPAGVSVFNPAFDVTPASWITGWITERGILRPPFTPRILGRG